VEFSAVDAPLQSLLTEFGPSGAAKSRHYPFWHLATDGQGALWNLSGPRELLKRPPGATPNLGELRTHHVQGGLRRNPPEVFTMSAEADIYPLQAPELAERIEGAIGEGSQFHQTYGYYAQGVGPETALLPRGWMSRVHRIQSAATNDRVGYCLDLPDLFMSKAAAGRDKDREFCMAMIEHGNVKPVEVLGLVDDMPLEEQGQRRLRSAIRRWVNAARKQGHEVSED